MRRVRVALATTASLAAALLAGHASLGGDAKPAPVPPHERTLEAGDHPRLVFSKAEVEKLREKVNAPGTWSRALLENALSKVMTAPGDPDFWPGLYAAEPVLSLLAAKEEDRKAFARLAIASSLAVSRKYELPYPDDPEWKGRFLYRYLALTYDCCYEAMTLAERNELRDALLRICAHIAAGNPEATVNNHAMAHAVGLGLAAFALDGEVPATPRTIKDEAVVRARSIPESDFLPFHSGFQVEKIGLSPGEARYEQGKDFEVRWVRNPKNVRDEGFSITWIKGGQAPDANATYYVTYTFAPDIAGWKDRARLSLQRNLDIVWGDGASMAGIQYGTWTLNWMMDLVECFRRNTALDFSQHPALRDAVRWLPTELLATDARFLRANNRNDSPYDQMDNVVRAGPYLAWCMTRYRDDPGKRDAIAYWLLHRSDEWQKTASWREAIWVSDALAGGSALRAPARLELPLSTFFRGHDLSNLRTGAWDGSMDDWSLFALVSGPYNGQEHDQTDKGSFTFYALGEDFAIDSGYAQGDEKSDATKAHNYILIDGKGQPGPWGTAAEVRSRFLSPSLDAVHADLRKSWVNFNQWEAAQYRKPDSWPVRSADRYALFVKLAGHAPYAVVSDSIEKDEPHAFTWLLHTQDGNALSIEGKGASIVGKRKGARLSVHLVAAAPLELSKDQYEPKEPPTHPRLLATATARNPRFLAILVPEKQGETDPLSVKTGEEKGARFATIAHVGSRSQDLIVSSLAGAVVRANGLETDAALAFVRTGEKPQDVLAWVVESGTVLKHEGKLLWQIGNPRGTRGDAAWDGKTLSVAAPEATELRAHAPGAKELVSGEVVLKGTSSGDTLVWSGKRPLGETYPQGTAVISEDFSCPVAPYWSVYPKAKPCFVRVVDGELCMPGLRPLWVSYTRRTSSPYRADVMTWPRCSFQDFVLKGDLTIVESAPGATVKIQARVSDRTFPENPPPDQDLVEVELNPEKQELVLSKRVDGGKPIAIAGAKAPLPKGKKHAFSLSIQQGKIVFSLDGASKIQAADAALPPAGYFQWAVAEGMHVHLDNVRVTVDP